MSKLKIITRVEEGQPMILQLILKAVSCGVLFSL